MNVALGPHPSRGLSKLGRFRIKTLDIYVMKSFIVAYAICFISFIGLFIIIEAFAKLDRFLRQDTNLILALIKYHLAMIPTVYANFMGPTLTLAAAMFTMTSLNRQNELTPLKAAGVSVYRIMIPIFFLAAGLTGVTFYLKEAVLPYYRETIRAALSLARSGPLNPPSYFDQQTGCLIHVTEYSTTRKIGWGIEISEQHQNGKCKQQIVAQHMEWIPDALGAVPDDGSWVLHEGSIQRWDDNGNLIVNASASRNEKLQMHFKNMSFVDTSLRPIDLEASDVEISYLSWRDLKKQFQRQPYHRHLAVKLHHQFAFPLAHIVLLFLGLPFVLNFRNKSGFISLAISFGICALFYLVSLTTMSIANQTSLLDPMFAAWLPIMLFGSLGLTLFDHLPT